MNLKKIYKNALIISDKIISEEKDDFVFDQVCDFFFSRVNPILKIEDLDNPPFYLEVTRDLGDGTYQTIGVPEKYRTYELPVEYRAIFTEISIHFLNEVEKDNIQFMTQMGAEMQGDFMDGSLLELEAKCNHFFLIEPSCIIIE